eukprot:EG_transcript_12573
MLTATPPPTREDLSAVDSPLASDPEVVPTSSGGFFASPLVDDTLNDFFRQLYQLPSGADYDTRRAAFDAVVPLLTAALPDRSPRVMAMGYAVTTVVRQSNNVLQLCLLQEPPVEGGIDIRKAVQSLMRLPELKRHVIRGTNPYWVTLKPLPDIPLGCTIGFSYDSLRENHYIRQYVLHCSFARPLMQLVGRWHALWAGTYESIGGDRLTQALHLMVLYFLLHEGLAPYLPPERVDLATLPAFPEFVSFKHQPVPWPYVLQLLSQFFHFYAQWPLGRAVVFSEPPTAVVSCQAKGWQAKLIGVEMPHRPSLNVTEFLTPKRWKALQATFAYAAATKDLRCLFPETAPRSPKRSQAGEFLSTARGTKPLTQQAALPGHLPSGNENEQLI